MRFSLAELQPILNGQLHGGDVLFERISTDTRHIQKGDLFVALQGPQFDGHDFVAAAFEKGAVGALLQRQVPVAIAQLLVKDTKATLGQLAKIRLANMLGKKIAVTGSCGKTTVKEILNYVLSQAGNVEVTQGNLNNDIGVPLTVWGMTQKNIDFRVFELGANHVGEIAYISALVSPDIAILTNAQAAHLSGFGGYQGVVKTKGEIITSLGDNGQAVLNYDDIQYDYWHGIAGDRKVWSVSINNPKAHVYAKQLKVGQQTSEFMLVIGQETHAVRLPLAGQHNVHNALVAAAAASAVGVNIEQIAQGLARCAPYKGRLVWHALADDRWIIDDSYNANPASVKAAIDVLAQQPKDRCLVLGDMGELGNESLDLHQEVGQYAANKGIEYLITLGKESRAASIAYSEYGGKNTLANDSYGELTNALESLATTKINYLVKGSRSSRMERVVGLLLDQEI